MPGPRTHDRHTIPWLASTLLRHVLGCGTLSASLCHAHLLTACGLHARSSSARAVVRDRGELGSIPSGCGWMAYRGAASVPYSADPGRDAGAWRDRRVAADRIRRLVRQSGVRRLCRVFSLPRSNRGNATKGVHQRCILSVHTLHMEIKHCERCGGDWCYRGTGRPLRCGKCKSPYWDRPRTGGKRQRVRKS